MNPKRVAMIAFPVLLLIVIVIGIIFFRNTEIPRKPDPEPAQESEPAESSIPKIKSLIQEEEQAWDSGDRKRAQELSTLKWKMISLAVKAYDQNAGREERRNIRKIITLLTGINGMVGAMQNPKANRAFLFRAFEVSKMTSKERRDVAWIADQRLQEEFAKLGVSEGFKSILPPGLSAEDNAVDVYAAMFEQIEEIGRNDPDSDEFTDISKGDQFPEDLDAAEAHLNRYRAVMTLLNDIETRKGLRFPVDWERNAMKRHPDRMRLFKLSKITHASSLANLALGHRAKARALARLQLRMVADYHREPVFLSWFVNVIQFELFMKTFEQLCLRDKPPAEYLHLVHSRLEGLDFRKTFFQAARGEAYSSVMSVQKYLPLGRFSSAEDVDGSPGAELVVCFWEDLIPLVNGYQKFNDSNSQGLAAVLETAQDLVKQQDDLPILSNLLFINFPQCARKLLKVEARMNIIFTALSLFRYRMEKGSYPEELGALVPKYQSSLLEDPFTGKPLRYQSGIIYSVGMNRKSDGGKDDDIPFRIR